MRRWCPKRKLERGLLVVLTLSVACATAGSVEDQDPDAGFINTPDAAPQPDAMVGPIDVTLSQSASETGEPGSIACIASTNGVPTRNRDNSYYRIFDLPTMGINKDLLVSKVTLGIESATSGAGGTQPINVKLHSLSGTFVRANLTQIVSAPVQVADQTNTMLDVNMSANVPAGTQLVVEVEVPDADPSPDHLFFIGSNGQGETGPSYLSSATCGFAEPVPIGTLQVDDGMGGTTNPIMHLILTVTGTY